MKEQPPKRRPVSIPKALENIETKGSNLRRIMPDALSVLDHRRAQVGNRLAQENPTHSNEISDPTGQLAQQLADIELQKRQLANAVRLILQAFSHADQLMRTAHHHTQHTPEDFEPCIGYPEGHECDEMPGYTFSKDGEVITRTNRLCDQCNSELERDERNAKRAQADRMRRHQPKMIA